MLLTFLFGLSLKQHIAVIGKFSTEYLKKSLWSKAALIFKFFDIAQEKHKVAPHMDKSRGKKQSSRKRRRGKRKNKNKIPTNDQLDNITVFEKRAMVMKIAQKLLEKSVNNEFVISKIGNHIPEKLLTKGIVKTAVNALKNNGVVTTFMVNSGEKMVRLLKSVNHTNYTPTFSFIGSITSSSTQTINTSVGGTSATSNLSMAATYQQSNEKSPVFSQKKYDRPVDQQYSLFSKPESLRQNNGNLIHARIKRVGVPTLLVNSKHMMNINKKQNRISQTQSDSDKTEQKSLPRRQNGTWKMMEQMFSPAWGDKLEEWRRERVKQYVLWAELVERRRRVAEYLPDVVISSSTNKQKYPVKCPCPGCEYECPREKLEQHLHHCNFHSLDTLPPADPAIENYEVVCLFSSFGCRHNCMLDDLPKHMEECDYRPDLNRTRETEERLKNQKWAIEAAERERRRRISTRASQSERKSQSMKLSEKMTLLQSQLQEEILSFDGNCRQRLKKQMPFQSILFRELSNLIHTVWPSGTITLVGSRAMNLALDESDIDVVFSRSQIQVESNYQNSALNALNDLHQLLKNASWIEQIKVIDARVPVLKATVCFETLKHCNVSLLGLSCRSFQTIQLDITYGERIKETGIAAAQFMRGMQMQYPELRPLVVTLKKLLRLRQLNDAFRGGLSSYALALMIASLIQKRTHRKEVDETILGELMMEALQVYGNEFDPAKSCISVTPTHDGKLIIPVLSDNSLTDSMVLKSGDGFKIIDPVQPNNNPGHSCYRIFQVKRVFSKVLAKILITALHTPSEKFGVDSNIVDRKDAKIFAPELLKHSSETAICRDDKNDIRENKEKEFSQCLDGSVKLGTAENEKLLGNMTLAGKKGNKETFDSLANSEVSCVNGRNSPIHLKSYKLFGWLLVSSNTRKGRKREVIREEQNDAVGENERSMSEGKLHD